LYQETQELAVRNQSREFSYEQLKMFIENDPELLGLNKECYQKTKNLIPPPPAEDESYPVPHHVVEEWRVAILKQCYLNEIFESSEDFVKKS